jgi:hypothetical protein
VSVDEDMNSDVSYIRAYIVPHTSNDYHHLTPSNSNGNYQKLLHRRQDLCNSARRSPKTVATYEQTLTFIEQLKRNQHRSMTEVNHQIPAEIVTDKKTLTPQELSYQLNLKLDYLIRTRAIERHRVINRTNILPSTKMVKSKITPRENLNQTAMAYISQAREKNVVSSTRTTNTTVIQDDLVDKDSLGDNDEAFEEMVEEENLTFLQQQP